MIRIIGRLAALGILGAALIVAYTAWRIVVQGARDEAQPADAIVVMGAAQYDGRPSPVFEARLEHAVALYREGVAPYLVVTGGRAEGDRTTEAAAARNYAIGHGVPAAAILVEDEARTTLESIRSVAVLLRDADLRSAVFVSDRQHMLRVLRMATDEGIVGWGSPTATSPIDRELGARLDATVHEIGALAIYFVTGDSP